MSDNLCSLRKMTKDMFPPVSLTTL